MKKNYLFIFTLIVFGLNSCKKEDDKQNKLSYDELVNRNEISNLSNEVFYYSDSTYYQILDCNNKLKSGGTFPYITLCDMAELVKPILQKYPSFDSLTIEDVEIIEQDFPTLTHDDIETNMEGIKLVYDAVEKYELY